jgi:hypothetical protein
MPDETRSIRGRLLDLLVGSQWRKPSTRQRDRQTPGYPEGTPAREALEALERVTSPDPSGRTQSGKPRMVSSADREEAWRILAGLRPTLEVRESVDPIHDIPLLTFKGKPLRMQSAERQRSLSARAEGSDPILPPVPASFIPSPLVLGEDAAKRFEEFAAINPEIRRTLKSIMTGPTPLRIEKILREDANYLGYKRNPLPRRRPRNKGTLWGSIAPTDPDRQHQQYKEIYLNPRLFGSKQAETMGHELGHVLFGTKQEIYSNRLQALSRELFKETNNRVPNMTLRDILTAELYDADLD